MATNRLENRFFGFVIDYKIDYEQKNYSIFQPVCSHNTFVAFGVPYASSTVFRQCAYYCVMKFITCRDRLFLKRHAVPRTLKSRDSRTRAVKSV